MLFTKLMKMLNYKFIHVPGSNVIAAQPGADALET